MASPAYIGAGAELDVYNSGGNASGSVLVPSGVSDGDFLLLVARNTRSTETITPPSGWTAISAHNKSSASQTDLLVYYRIASSEPSGYTISNSGVIIQAQIFAYEAATFETSAVWEGSSSSTTIACPSVTSGGADRTLICVYGQFGNGSVSASITYTAPSGMTQRAENRANATPSSSTYTSFALSDKAISASGATGTQNATASIGDTWHLAVSVLIETSGGGGGSSIAAISNFYRMMRSA